MRSIRPGVYLYIKIGLLIGLIADGNSATARTSTGHWITRYYAQMRPINPRLSAAASCILSISCTIARRPIEAIGSLIDPLGHPLARATSGFGLFPRYRRCTRETQCVYHLYRSTQFRIIVRKWNVHGSRSNPRDSEVSPARRMREEMFLSFCSIFTFYLYKLTLSSFFNFFKNLFSAL